MCVWAAPGNGLVTRETRVPRCTKSDAAGAYTLTDLFPATPLVVSASAPSFAPVGHGDLRLSEGEQRAGVDLVLRGGGVRLDGTVDDVTGGAVAGAIVATQDEANRALATTDAKGEFTLIKVEPGLGPRPARRRAGYAPGVGHGSRAWPRLQDPPRARVDRLVGRSGDRRVPGRRSPAVMIDGIQVEGGNNARLDADRRRGRVPDRQPAPGR